MSTLVIEDHISSAIQENILHGYIYENYCANCEKILEAIDEAGECVHLELEKLKVCEESRQG